MIYYVLLQVMYIHIVLPKTLTNKVANPQPTSRHCKSGLGAANVTWDGRIATAKMNMENGVFIFWEGNILLMVQKSGDHQLRGRISHVLQGFLHPRWCRNSSINSSSQDMWHGVSVCFCFFCYTLSHPPHIGMVYSFHIFPLMLDQQQICIYHKTIEIHPN